MLNETLGGLLSFNNFLSTSRKKKTALDLAKGSLGHKDQVSILFVMSVDPELHRLMKMINKEVQGAKGWSRIGRLLIIVRELDKAEDVYNSLLEITGDDRADSYDQLGTITDAYTQLHYITTRSHLKSDGKVLTLFPAIWLVSTITSDWRTTI